MAALAGGLRVQRAARVERAADVAAGLAASAVADLPGLAAPGGGRTRVGAPAGRRSGGRAALAAVLRVRRAGGIERSGDEAAGGAAPSGAELPGPAARAVDRLRPARAVQRGFAALAGVQRVSRSTREEAAVDGAADAAAAVEAASALRTGRPLAGARRGRAELAAVPRVRGPLRVERPADVAARAADPAGADAAIAEGALLGRAPAGRALAGVAELAGVRGVRVAGGIADALDLAAFPAASTGGAGAAARPAASPRPARRAAIPAGRGRDRGRLARAGGEGEEGQGEEAWSGLVHWQRFISARPLPFESTVPISVVGLPYVEPAAGAVQPEAEMKVKGPEVYV